MGREEHRKQILLVCVGSAHSVWTTLGLPQLTAACAFWVYTAQAAGCFAGHCPKQALGFLHFPGLSCLGQVLGYAARAQIRLSMCFVPFPGPSSSGNQVLGKLTVLCGLCILITSPVPAAWFPGCAARAPSQVCPVSPLGSLSLPMTLLGDVNCPWSQEDLVSSCKPAHSLVEDAVSGAEIAPHLPVLAVARLPLWLGVGRSTAS